MNAVHDALNNGHDYIAMCIYIDEGFPIIHFINIDNDGNYTDNTLGRWSETLEYYLVKTIKKDDFFNVNNIFIDYRIHLSSNIPWYIRMFIKDVEELF